MTRRQRSAADWSATPRRGRIARLICIAGGAILAASLTLALALDGVVEADNPLLALTVDPTDAGALAARAEQLFTAQPERPPVAVRRLALASLRHQALNPQALRLLGYLATVQGDETLARNLILLSERQSRRDAGAQLWLIEDVVQRGDVRAALAHYDVVLRTHPATYTTLFPILVQALSDPGIRAALAPYVRRDETWAPLFLAHAVANSNDLPALVDLVVRSGGLKNQVAAHAQNLALFQRLVAAKMFAAAYRLAVRVEPARVSALASTGFSRTDGGEPVDSLGWQLRTEVNAGGDFLGGAGGRPVLSIFANSATLATVATKLLYLPPGRYRFAATLSQFQGGDGAQLRWQLRCPAIADDRPVWSLDSGGRSVSVDLTIPQDCTVQYLDVIASGGSGSDGMTATIAAVSLRRRDG